MIDGDDTPHSIALVHDYLLVMRGAERAFAAIAECWPEAPIYTLLYSSSGTEGRFATRSVRTSYLQRLGADQRNFRQLLPLYQRAAASLPVSHYDVVISSSSAFAHGVRTAPDAVHVCYCHTPFRYAWHERDRTLAEVFPPLRLPLNLLLRKIRAVDRTASMGVTQYVANSRLTQMRIKRFYGRHAPIVHPPVAVERFAIGIPEDFFLLVAETLPHKRVEIALEAARLARRRIKVVGTGPDFVRLRAAYGRSAEFMGRVSDDELADLYARALALVMPNEEEFGIAAVEAQAAGRPVLALDAGGARETVIDRETGVLISHADAGRLAHAMVSTNFDSFDSARIVRHAQRFAVSTFQRRFLEVVAQATKSQLPASAH